MPFDGTKYQDQTLVDAIALLERGLQRVTTGYCAYRFYRPKTWYRWSPKYCMAGALYHDDLGKREYSLYSFEAKYWADSLLVQQIGGKSLVEFGTRFGAKKEVIAAYKAALVEAKRMLHAHD